MNLKEVDSDPGDWLDLAEDRDHRQAYLRTVLNLRVP